jgi:1-acyl-sn-glycerol-3-phosphate acyltransferase
VDEGEHSSGTRRRRPQTARVSPERLAAKRGSAEEGLVWLGRQPETRPSLLYWSLRLLARLVLFGAFRFRIETLGQEHIPPGGYLLVGATHRGWMDPFLVLHALPAEPRQWFLGSAATAFSSRWRERLLHRVGGMLPVWRGGVGVEQHVAAATAVIGNGGVFVVFPEGGVIGPPDRVSTFRVGAGLIALRTGATMVPLVMVGTRELYLGRRMASRILPPTNAHELLGASWDGRVPLPGTRDELELARRLTERLEMLLGPEVAALYPATIDPPDRPRRLRGLTWFLLKRTPRDTVDAA